MDYAEYLDQLTYLLFLKMADERRVHLPEGTGWEHLTHTPNDHILDVYREMLVRLKSTDGLVGDVYSSATSSFRRPSSLKQILTLLDQVEWSTLPSDVQAEAFEYLLEQAAAEGKKGAGQYFTPRILVESIVECVKPGAIPSDELVSDPAAGTAGFLIAAHAWVTKSAGDGERVIDLKFHGTELVPRARRLGLMNLILHQVRDPYLALADSIYDERPTTGYDVVLTNPPFGSKGGSPPHRPDFWAVTGSKQLNFVQHVVSTLREGGRAAIILPDNCFFGDQAAQLWPGLVERCNVHTVLRLPNGSFAPYTAGTRTNVLFLTKGQETETTWVYDGRTGFPAIGRANPFTANTLEEFRLCYGPDPLAHSRRTSTQSSAGRWSPFDIAELVTRRYQLDQLPWQAPTDATESNSSPVVLLEDILKDVEAVAEEVRGLIKGIGG